MDSDFCRKSVCSVAFSIITTFCLSAQENNALFKQLIKDSLKDLVIEPLKPEILISDSLLRKLKLDLNKDLLFMNKQQLTFSENLFKPYTNNSKLYPSHTGTLNSLTNKITFDNSSSPKRPSGMDINEKLMKVLFGKEIYKKFDDVKYTESEKQAIIEKTNQIIQESRLTTKSDSIP